MINEQYVNITLFESNLKLFIARELCPENRKLHICDL